MAARARVLIAGGYGVFGRLLARELVAHTDLGLVLAGRDVRRAEEACRRLPGGRAEPLALDLRAPEPLAEAARGCFAVACAAGPFQDLGHGLPLAAVSAGAHWLDIADDARWVLAVLDDEDLHRRALAAGLAVMTGLSSVPALSGALVRWCRQRLPLANHARIALSIGNRNAKGPGAIASALATGFTDPSAVRFPSGRRRAYRFHSPDEVLLRRRLGLDAEFRVALESRIAGRFVAAAGPLVARLRPGARASVARAIAVSSRPFGLFGSASGAVQAEVEDGTGRRAGAALVATDQRLAILPCALAMQELIEGRALRGVLDPAEWLSPDEWVARLRARGVRFYERVARSDGPTGSGTVP